MTEEQAWDRLYIIKWPGESLLIFLEPWRRADELHLQENYDDLCERDRRAELIVQNGWMGVLTVDVGSTKASEKREALHSVSTAGQFGRPQAWGTTHCGHSSTCPPESARETVVAEWEWYGSLRPTDRIYYVRLCVSGTDSSGYKHIVMSMNFILEIDHIY